MDQSQTAVAEPIAHMAECVTSAGHPRRAGKILLATGNRLNEKVAARLLQLDAHRVTTVTTGEQVVTALLQSAFDLVLMDAELPELSGVEATKLIRAKEVTTGHHTPIVAMTSSAVQGNECLQAGMDQQITKPLNIDQLRRAIACFVRSVDSEPAFDQAAALARVRDDRAFLCTLASMFVESAPTQIADIRTAIEHQNAHGLSRAAHKLKGSVYPFCAMAVTNAAQALESIGESGQLAAAMDKFREFESETGRLLTALTELTHSADGQAGPNSNIAGETKGTTPCIV